VECSGFEGAEGDAKASQSEIVFLVPGLVNWLQGLNWGISLYHLYLGIASPVL
jgi:hypothetical protein